MTKNSRGFERFGTALKAYYVINSDKGEAKHDCIVTNMSRKGFCIQVKADKKIGKDSVMRLEIYVPEKKSPTLVQGIVKWVEKRGEFWSAGVECLQILDEMEFSKLR